MESPPYHGKAGPSIDSRCSNGDMSDVKLERHGHLLAVGPFRADRAKIDGSRKRDVPTAADGASATCGWRPQKVNGDRPNSRALADVPPIALYGVS